MAFGNAPGSASVKFPCPSFKRTATGRFNHCVDTTRSGTSSPFTSCGTICSPPEGALKEIDRAAPPLSSNRMEYCVVRVSLPPTRTVAISGFKSPSKSAIANRCPTAEARTGFSSRGLQIVAIPETNKTAAHAKRRTGSAVPERTRRIGLSRLMQSQPGSIHFAKDTIPNIHRRTFPDSRFRNCKISLHSQNSTCARSVGTTTGPRSRLYPGLLICCTPGAI
jgi:hypothetical protein